MNDLHHLITDNQNLLSELAKSISQLHQQMPAAYSSLTPRLESASPGAHVRHILDFYDCLLCGLDRGVVDYDTRNRAKSIEQSATLAIELINKVSRQLNELAAKGNRDIRIIASTNDQQTYPQQTYPKSSFPQIELRSNLARELQALHSHTTHHMALIALAIKLNGLEINDSFGKSPSTIKFETDSKSA